MRKKYKLKGFALELQYCHIDTNFSKKMALPSSHKKVGGCVHNNKEVNRHNSRDGNGCVYGPIFPPQ